MDTGKFSGRWSGTYTYTHGYPPDWLNKTEPFTMDLQFDGANFRGTCADNYTSDHFGQPATIVGTFSPNLIDFIKKYSAWLETDNEGKVMVDNSRPSFEIHYSGLLYRGLFSRTYRFKGDWKITVSLPDVNGRRGLYTCGGSWKMKKDREA